MKTRLAPVLLLLGLLTVAALPAQDSSRDEKRRATDHLQTTRDTLLDAVSTLTPEQWAFKPGPNRWSVGEVVEHLSATEAQLLRLIEDQVMKAPARPEPVDLAEIDQFILRAIPDRSRTAQAPEELVPNNRFGSAEATLQAFRDARARTLDFLAQTEGLRDHAIDSPFGRKLDAYQWLLFISAHCERHTRQIAEVKADPNFPATAGGTSTTSAPKGS